MLAYTETRTEKGMVPVPTLNVFVLLRLLDRYSTPTAESDHSA